MITLTQASPFHEFPAAAQPSSKLSTAGALSGASVKLSYRHLESQAWIPYEDGSTMSNEHFAGEVRWMGLLNRIELLGASGGSIVTVRQAEPATRSSEQ